MIELRPIEESVAYQEIFRDGEKSGERKGMQEGIREGLLRELSLLEELREQIDPATYRKKVQEIRADLEALDQERE